MATPQHSTIVRLQQYFELLPGQTMQEFFAEVQQLPDRAKDELVAALDALATDAGRGPA